MRILMITPDYTGGGGIQTCVQNWSLGLTQLGHDVSVLHIEPGDDHRKLRDFVALLGGRCGVYERTVKREANAAIESFDPDVVHAMHVGVWPAIDVANDRGLPTVLTTYALELGDDSAGRAVRSADAVTALSPQIADWLDPVRDDPLSISVIPPSIDVSRYRDAAMDTPRGPVVTMARHVERKQIGTIIRSWDLDDHGRDLVVCGEGPKTPYLKSIASNDRIRFAGWVEGDEKTSLLQEASVFALTPTVTGVDVEGFGIVYIEAQAAMTPVVGSASGGAPFAIGDGGIVLDRCDNPKAVADAIDDLLDPGVRQAAIEATERVWTFDIENVTDEWIDLYESVAAGIAVGAE